MDHLRPAPKPVSSKRSQRLDPKFDPKPIAQRREAKAPLSAEDTSVGQAVDMSTEKRLKRNAKARGKYAEQRVADLLGGKLTISSGRTALEKGDVRVDYANLFVEVKYCGVRQGKGDTSVTFDREWLEKTILDAEAVGMLPVIALRFRDGSGAYATTADVFEKLLAHVHALHDENQVLFDLQTLFPAEMASLVARRQELLENLEHLERRTHSL